MISSTVKNGREPKKMIICFYTREYWMINIGPGFLEVIRLLPLPPVSRRKCCLSFSVFLCAAGRGGGRGAESYDRKKAWSFINNFCSIQYNVHTYLNIRGNGERKTEGAHSDNSHPHIHAENKFQQPASKLVDKTAIMYVFVSSANVFSPIYGWQTGKKQ